MAGSGTALSVEQIEQMKQNSPEYQQRQTTQQNEQMLRQKWQGILSDNNTVPGGIYPPENPEERNIALQVAQEMLKKTNMFSPADNVRRGVLLTFIRQCNVYVKQRDKQAKKDLRKMQTGENRNIAGYSQMDLTPKSDNIADVFKAAENAGMQAAYFFKSNNQQGYDGLMQSIKGNFGNDAYNVIFHYTYYSHIKYDNMAKEQQRTQRLNSIQQRYNNYYSKVHAGEFNKDALDKTLTGMKSNVGGQDGR